MRIEFEKLEQRPGTRVVPLKMSREDLETLAEKMADVNTKIEVEESDLRRYTKQVRDRVKVLEDERHAITNTYKFKREPKPVEGLWGFEFENHGRASCRTCMQRHEKNEHAVVLFDKFDDLATLSAEHDSFEFDDGHKHPLMPQWERPLGTKWFVEPSSGDVFGPISVVERDLQKELQPEMREIEPFALAFDSETAVPLLDEKEVSAAEKKLKESEEDLKRESIAEDVHESCGLPQAWHPEPTEGELLAAEESGKPFDACKAAMLRAANEENAAQARRTQEKYGSDEALALSPDETYDCGRCGVPTFGRDLQPVTVDGKKTFACFACEQNLPQSDPEPEKKPKKRAPRKRKGGGEATA